MKFPRNFSFVAVIALFGNVKAEPGLFFPSETKYPVYYVRQSHPSGPPSYGPSYSSKPQSYGSESPYEYLERSPSSGISPYSIFSEPLPYVPFPQLSTLSYGPSSSGGRPSYGPSSSKPTRGRRPKVMMMRQPPRQPVVEEEPQEVDDSGPFVMNDLQENEQFEDANEVNDEGQSGNLEEDPNSQFEQVDPIVQRQPSNPPRPSMMQMNPPRFVMMTQQPQRQNRPAQQRPRAQPQQQQMFSNEVQDDSQDQMEDFPAGGSESDAPENEIEQGEPQDVMQTTPRGRPNTSGSTRPRKPSSSGKPRGNSNQGWTSAISPFDDTFFGHDFFSTGPSYTSGLYTVNSGGSGWGWGPPPPSSSSSGPAPPPPPGSVDEVGITEESEARRPPSGRARGPIQSPNRRPSSSSGTSSPSRRPSQSPQSPSTRPQSSRSNSGRSNTPSSAPRTNPTSSSSSRTRTRNQSSAQAPSQLRSNAESQPTAQQGSGSSGRQINNEMMAVRPLTNEAGQRDTGRPEYGPPAQTGSSSESRGNPLGDEGQIISTEGSSSSNGGLLDADLIRTVQQIISTFDN